MIGEVMVSAVGAVIAVSAVDVMAVLAFLVMLYHGFMVSCMFFGSY